MPIPDCDHETGYLPPGLHQATIREIKEVLGFTPKRRTLASNLEYAANSLFRAGVADLRIDGSYVTQKPVPGDIDGFWIWHEQVKWEEIPAILVNFERVQHPITGQYKFPMWFQLGLELFIHPFQQGTETEAFPEFFSKSRDGVPRGYIQVIPE